MCLWKNETLKKYGIEKEKAIGKEKEIDKVWGLEVESMRFRNEAWKYEIGKVDRY